MVLPDMKKQEDKVSLQVSMLTSTATVENLSL